MNSLKIQLPKVNVTIRILLKRLSLIREETQIAKNFDKFFTEIGPKFAKEIETPTKKFDDYLEQCDTIQPDNRVSIIELKDAFFSLQTNKSSGYDGISFNIVQHYFGSLHKPFLHLFIY